jgi:hypothetical protein
MSDSDEEVLNSTNTYELRAAIKNFQLPNAKETLYKLGSLEPEDLFPKANENVDVHISGVMTAFSEADLESMQFILDNHIMSPTMLCYGLKGLFHCYTLIPWNRIDMVKIINLLLDYLINEYPIVISHSRVDSNLYRIGPLLYHLCWESNYNYSKETTEWISKLINVGCDPFEQSNHNNPTTSFHELLHYNKYDLIMNIVEKYPNYNYSDLLKSAINHSQRKRNCMQEYLFDWALCKKAEILTVITKIIVLMIKLGADLEYQDSLGMNTRDYIEYYDYKNLLIQELGYHGYLALKLPEPTGAKPEIAKFYTYPDEYKYVGLFIKYHYAKTQSEFNELRIEYAELKRSVDPITKEQRHYDFCDNDDYIISSVAYWNIDDVIPEIDFCDDEEVD